MEIRKATLKDFDTLYALGLETEELRVSSLEPFMDEDQFKLMITSPDYVFLVGLEGAVRSGFVCAHADDANAQLQHRYACLVYLAVHPAFRRRGIGRQLYVACEEELHRMGITHVYGWAYAEGSGEILSFMKRQGFVKGHQYVWMDKRLEHRRPDGQMRPSKDGQGIHL
jgi:ribosomal protein S18 acetylase RimI-like enzyme